MFMNAGDFHLDVKYEGEMWTDTIMGHQEGKKVASIHEKYI